MACRLMHGIYQRKLLVICSSYYVPYNIFFLPSLGDLGELKKFGSLHEYLLYLHDNGCIPVTSFWWGKEQVVSVCSPQAFQDTAHLTDRAG